MNALIRVREPALAVETARKARALAAPDGGETDAEAAVALGYGLCFAGRFSEARPHLQRAVELVGASAANPLRAGRLSAALGWLGLHELAHDTLAETVRRARAAGAVGSLPHLLASSAWQALHASRWNEAEADAGEALELADEIDQPVTATQALGVLTWVRALRGDEAQCRAYADETQRRAAAFGFRLYQLLVSHCLALLDLGLGRVDDAIGRLEEVARHADERALYIPGVSPQLELAEAYVRVGRTADAEAILASFERSDLASAPLPAALAARCRGLLAETDALRAGHRPARSGPEPVRARPDASVPWRAAAPRGAARRGARAAPAGARDVRADRREAVGRTRARRAARDRRDAAAPPAR